MIVIKSAPINDQTATAISEPSPTDDSLVTVYYDNAQDPYAGLNRAQRRAAISKERRAFKKRRK